MLNFLKLNLVLLLEGTPFWLQLLFLSGFGSLLGSLVAFVFQVYFDIKNKDEASFHLGGMAYLFFYTGVLFILIAGCWIWYQATQLI